MKLKSLIVALPVLCFACSNPGSDTSDPASQMDASPILAKRPTGLAALTTDFNYDEPCNILGEEYVRQTFNLGETVKLEEGHEHGGCDFAWEGGSKVVVSFGGTRPYSSTFMAEYQFDKMYQGKSDAQPEPVADVHEQEMTNSSEGTNPEAMVADSAVSEHPATEDHQPTHGGVTAATPHLTAPAVSKGNFEAIANVGDKAVWDATTGAMHVLYNNHIINVTVETKDKAEVKKERAASLVEVIIEKINENEYIRRL